MQKILVIDDEKNLRETLCKLLTHGGFEVHEAKDGQQGIEKVKQTQPHLIICDIMMPILDGYSFLKQHQKSINSDIPVLLISAKTEQLDEVLSRGIKGYLSKPFKYNELIAQVNNAFPK